MSTFDPQEQLKISKAAALLDYSPRTIWRMIEQGKLDTVGTGKLRRVTRQSIATFQEKYNSRKETDDARETA